MNQAAPTRPITRRKILSGAIAIAGLPLTPAQADDDMKAQMLQVLDGREPKSGRVSITLPELSENGNSTPVAIAVDSPMTPDNYVRAIHLFSEKNPVKYVCRIGLSSRNGRAKVATNIRLADSQMIIAVAELSDGTVWQGSAEIIVTTPACIDDSFR